MSTVLWYVFWIAIALTLMCVVGTMFIHDVARFQRREPLRIPFVGVAVPGDLAYPLALIELFGPYVAVAAAFLFFGCLAAYLTIFPG